MLNTGNRKQTSRIADYYKKRRSATLVKKVIHDLGDSLSNNISLSVGIHGTYPTVPLNPWTLIRHTQTQVAVKYNLIETTLQTLEPTQHLSVIMIGCIYYAKSRVNGNRSLFLNWHKIE